MFRARGIPRSLLSAGYLTLKHISQAWARLDPAYGSSKNPHESVARLRFHAAPRLGANDGILTGFRATGYVLVRSLAKPCTEIEVNLKSVPD